MTETPRVGMVEEIDVTGAGPSDGAIAFVRAYVADGPLDPAIAKQFLAPELVAAREARAAAQRVLDWPNLNYYRSANAGMVTAPDCVFIGSSITEMWMAGDPALFEGGNVSRGISGQTSAQMLLRFMADVVALKPRVVHVLVGVNDIAGNTGPTTLNDYCNNMMAMMLLAEAHGIRVILGTLAPHAKIPWAQIGRAHI